MATPTEYRALALAAVIAAMSFVRVASPIGAGLFLGALVAFTLYPFYRRLTAWTSRPTLAALACAFIAWLFVTGGTGGLLLLLINRGAALSKQVPTALSEGGPVDRSANEASEKLGSYGIHSRALDEHLHHAVEELEGLVGTLLGKAATSSFAFLLTMFFMVVTTYFVLRHWARLAHWTEALLPLRPRHTRTLIRELRSLGREAMLGTLLLGLIQGFLAGAGYAVAGAPQPAFFGAMTAVASTLPALGTFLVWAPIGAYLVGTGHVVAGVLELCWGFLVVVMFSDGFLRPKIVGGRSKMGMLPTLIGLFGGLELLGFVGLLVGPTIVGLSLTVLRMYAWERASQRRALRSMGAATSAGPASTKTIESSIQ